MVINAIVNFQDGFFNKIRTSKTNKKYNIKILIKLNRVHLYGSYISLRFTYIKILVPFKTFNSFAIESKETFFLPSQRSMLVWHILCHTSFSRRRELVSLNCYINFKKVKMSFHSFRQIYYKIFLLCIR